MKLKRAIADMASIVWTALLNGKDSEFGYPAKDEQGNVKLNSKGNPTIVNTAGYGYESAMQYIVDVLAELKIPPRHLIMVKEGMNSKGFRQSLHPGYKAGRDKLPEQYVEYNKCLQMVIDQFLAVGAQLAWQDGGIEGDDVVAYLAVHLDGERWIISSDKDMAALVDPEVGIHQYRMGSIDQNPFGDFAHKLIPVYLALVGDSGDKIPGAVGFGHKAWLEVFSTFGDDGIVALGELIRKRELSRLREDVAECSKLQKIMDQADNVYLSYDLARLYIDKVNTLQKPLQWKAGMVKPQTPDTDERLRRFAQQVHLVSAENYEKAVEFAKKHIPFSPYVTLDIETSTPPESDEWLERLDKSEDKTPVDVFGSGLTGLSINFGWNLQHTLYLTHDHVEEEGVTNLSLAQVRDFVNLVPREKLTIVHNAAFELPVCYMEWGADWKDDPEYHGFLRNVVDSAIMSSYVNENRSKGLKSLSSEVLSYEQETYQQVTTLAMSEHEFRDRGSRGKVLQRSQEEGVPDLLQVQYKMNDLTARHVLNYGADDSICSAALANHFICIMEIEKTWDVFMEVEQFPAYVTALAFVDGVEFSLETMRAMEKADDEAFDSAAPVLRDYLFKIGYEGTICPTFTDMDPASIHTAFLLLTGEEFPNKRLRKLDSISKTIVQWGEEADDEAAERARLLAGIIDEGSVGLMSDLVARYFEGEPKLDLNSPKQMARLLYDVMKLPVNLTNDVTAIEYMHSKPLAEAVRKHKKWRMGDIENLSLDEWALVRKKAKADDDAISFALAFNADQIDDDARAALKAVSTIKTVMTRRQLFYSNYWRLVHWKDGKIHSQANQCAAVTRRYSMSNPNLQQLPKHGEGVAFRGCFLPHRKDAVVCSIDYSGQELRLAAERSQDKNMLACYIGEHLKDPHSITASGAMKMKWGVAAVKELAAKYGSDLIGEDAEYELFLRLRKTPEVKKKADDLRKDSKNVNFTAQFGGQALKASSRLIMLPKDAQLFLDARNEMFPGIVVAAKKAEDLCKKTGRAYTMMGAIRHLEAGITSDDRGEAARAARQAWNMEIQGSASEMTKIGVGRLWKSGALHKYDVKFFAIIHDELVDSVHKDHALEYIRIKHECMTGPYANMKVPILGSISIGPNFKDQHEAGDDFDGDAVLGAVWVSTNDPLPKELTDRFSREAQAANANYYAYLYRNYINLKEAA